MLARVSLDVLGLDHAQYRDLHAIRADKNAEFLRDAALVALGEFLVERLVPPDGHLVDVPTGHLLEFRWWPGVFCVVHEFRYPPGRIAFLAYGSFFELFRLGIGAVDEAAKAWPCLPEP